MDNNLEEGEISLIESTVSTGEYDLDTDLLRMGWRKCFSKREKRVYYYNKLTNQSVWSLNEIKQRSAASPENIISPSNVSSSNTMQNQNAVLRCFKNTSHVFFTTSSFYSPSPSDSFEYSYGSPSPSLSSYDFMSPTSEKRSRKYSWESDEAYDSQNYQDSKRLKHENKWDLDVKSNVITFERPMFLMLPPHPDIEIERTNLFHTTSQNLFDWLQKVFPFDIQITTELIQNLLIYWLIEIKIESINYQTNDPIFTENKYDKIEENYSRLLKEIIFRIFLDKLFESLNSNEKKSFKSEFEFCVKNLNDLIDKFNLDKKNFKNEFDVENNEEWFNKSNDLINQLLNKFYEILDHEFIKIYDNLNENLLKNSIDLLQRHRILYDKNKIKILTEPPKYNQEKKIMCYPLLMCTPSLYLPSPTKTYDQDSGLFYLAYNKEELPIRQDYFYKLKKLYEINCKDDPKEILFLSRVWCLLKRYELLNIQEESYQFYSLMPSVVKYLADVFRVTFELFSTPLNSYFAQFCSAFCDIDSYFGSRGSMFDFTWGGGSYLLCLPFSESLAEKILTKLENSLTNEKVSLTFILVIPLCRNEEVILKKFNRNKFLRHQFKLKMFQHSFSSSSNYKNVENCFFQSRYDSLIAVFQNDSATREVLIFETDIEQLKMLNQI